MFRPKNALDRSVLVVRRMFTNKPEIGIILLGNLKSGDQPLKMLDRKVLVTPDQCRVVFQALAKLHGSWLKWRNKAKAEETLDGIRDVDVKSLEFQTQPWMIKPSLSSNHKTFMACWKAMPSQNLHSVTRSPRRGHAGFWSIPDPPISIYSPICAQA